MPAPTPSCRICRSTMNMASLSATDGSSHVVIQFCPWCGEHLPESKRARWLEELEKRGLHPLEDPVPPEFQSGSKRGGSSQPIRLRLFVARSVTTAFSQCTTRCSKPIRRRWSGTSSAKRAERTTSFACGLPRARGAPRVTRPWPLGGATHLATPTPQRLPLRLARGRAPPRRRDVHTPSTRTAGKNACSRARSRRSEE